MKYNRIYKSKYGFSTVELLIAMAILVISLTAIILVSFGTQSILIDSQTSSEAINLAQEFLEKEQSLARKDFKLVNSRAATTVDIYEIKVDVVATSSNPLLANFTKKITATVSWPDQYNRGLNVQLSALITNFENANGGDSCNSILSGNWAAPSISNFFVSDTDNNAKLSVDAYKQKLYAAISDANATDTPTIFVYDLSLDPKNPVLISSLDNWDTEAGINDIHATDGYLYVAKATSASGQLQIFNTSDWSSTTFKVDPSLASGIGNSIFYKDGYVYLGLTAASGPEFHIIDVHSPSNPFEVGYWPQTGRLGNDINAIYIKGKHVYLATPNTEDLIILDISNPTLPVQVDSFDSSGGGHGKSLYSVGDTLYLGKTEGSSPELYILNNPDLSAISVSSSQEISESVDGLLVRDYLAFLTTNTQLQIWRIDNPASIFLYNDSPLTLPSASDNPTSLDCEGNYIYTGSVDASNKAYLSVIYTP
jgi:type II secretory pathway pseudopilin PulG